MGPLGISILVSGLLAGFLLTYLWISSKGRALLEESELRFEQVPDLMGMSLGDAKKALSTTTLKLGTPKDDGKITEQGCAPGTVVREGSSVKVDVEPAAPSGEHTTPTSVEVTMSAREPK